MESKIRTKTFPMLLIILMSLYDCHAFDGNHTHHSFDKGKEFKKRLRVGVPLDSGFPELLNVQYDLQTNKTNASGFCIDVFKAAIEILPYQVHYEFIAYGNSSASYDDIVHQVHLQKFDAAVGDISITANRSLYVDFTLPFTDPGMGMVGRKQNEKSKWFFLKPLAADLWLASAGLFLFTGFVVWVIERPKNDEFQGSLSQQIGTAFWFSFSTLFFAHWERLLSNLSRFVVIMWVFVVLVLTSSYTATLTSMLTVQQINLNSKNNDIGYRSGSFTSGCISTFNFQNSNLQPFESAEAYDKALSRGSKDGGVSAIVDEIPYIKLFLAKYPKHYSMIGSPLSTTNGFAFVFPKGSQMVRDMSWAIATLRSEERLIKMERAMLNTQTDVTFEETANNNITPLTFERFQSLFLISGLSSVLALTSFSLFVLRSKWHILVKHYDRLIGQKFKSIKRYMSEKIIFTRTRGKSNVVHPV